MKKYIDAEKLIAEIERWRDKAKEKYNESTYSMGRCDALAEFRNHIVSLQQEQPKLPGYDKALLEVKSKVDELYEEAGIGLCEYDTGLYNGIAETCMKLRGFIKARLASDEQPEVDLDAIVDEAFDKYSSVDGYGQLSVSFNRAELYSFIKKIARKEEMK